MGANCKRPHEMRCGARARSSFAIWFWALTALCACSEPKIRDDSSAPALDGDVSTEGQADASEEVARDAAPRDASIADTTTPPPNRSDAGDDARAPAIDGGSLGEGSGLPGADAANADASSPPATDASSGSWPSWVAELPGRYAIDMVWFTDDGVFVARTHEVALAEIARVGDALTMSMQQCEWVVTNRIGALRMSAPAKLPVRRFNILAQADSFRMEPLDIALGFDPTPPPECANRPGALVQKRPYQTWIAGESCRCPSSALPMLDDCRVTDADADDRPGYTVDTKLANEDWKIFAATERRSVIVNGRPSTGGSFTAQLEGDESSQQLGSVPSGADDLSGTIMPCLPRYNRVTFTALDRRIRPEGGWSCDAVLNQRAELFPMAPPATPARGTCR